MVQERHGRKSVLIVRYRSGGSTRCRAAKIGRFGCHCGSHRRQRLGYLSLKETPEKVLQAAASETLKRKHRDQGTAV